MVAKFKVIPTALNFPDFSEGGGGALGVGEYLFVEHK